MVKQKTPEHLKRIDLSHKLSQLRLKNNLNPHLVSKVAKIDLETILTIELGPSKYFIDSFLKYIDALEVDIQFVDRSSTVS